MDECEAEAQWTTRGRQERPELNGDVERSVGKRLSCARDFGFWVGRSRKGRLTTTLSKIKETGYLPAPYPGQYLCTRYLLSRQAQPPGDAHFVLAAS